MLQRFNALTMTLEDKDSGKSACRGLPVSLCVRVCACVWEGRGRIE
jgi:hypothetical protein